MQTPLDNQEHERGEYYEAMTESLMDKMIRWGFYAFFLFPGFIMCLYAVYKSWF